MLAPEAQSLQFNQIGHMTAIMYSRPIVIQRKKKNMLLVVYNLFYKHRKKQKIGRLS